MDALLNHEQLLLVNTVRQFVETEIYPYEELIERTGDVPHDLAQKIKQKTLDLRF